MEMTLSELQTRLVALIRSIDDPDVLARVQSVIDGHKDDLRVLDEREMDAILSDLRPDRDD